MIKNFLYGGSILTKSRKISLKSRTAHLLLLLFFFIPAFTILGPLFPDLIISVTVLFSLIISLKDHDKKFKQLITKDIFIISFLLFFLYLFFSSLISFIESNNLSYENFKSFFSRSLFFFRFGLYPVCFVYLMNKFNFLITKKHLLYFLVTILFVVFDLVFQYFNGSDIFGFIPMQRGEVALNRLSGPFNDELIPGAFLMRYFFIFLLFIFFFINQKKILNFTIPFSIFILLITIFLTGERAATLLSIFGIFIFFIIFKEFRLKILLSSAACLLLIVIVLISNPVLKKRMVNDTLFQLGISKYLDNKEETIVKKISNTKITKFLDSHYGAHWETAYRIWLDNKYFGIGLKQFRNECSNAKYDDIKSKLRSIRCATHPHNSYFEILSETGLFGLLFFVFLVFSLFRKIFLIYSYNISVRLPLISVILIVWPFITTGSFFTNMTQIHFSFILTIILMIEKNLFKNFKI